MVLTVFCPCPSWWGSWIPNWVCSNFHYNLPIHIVGSLCCIKKPTSSYIGCSNENLKTGLWVFLPQKKYIVIYILDVQLEHQNWTLVNSGVLDQSKSFTQLCPGVHEYNYKMNWLLGGQFLLHPGSHFEWSSWEPLARWSCHFPRAPYLGLMQYLGSQWLHSLWKWNNYGQSLCNDLRPLLPFSMTACCSIQNTQMFLSANLWMPKRIFSTPKRTFCQPLSPKSSNTGLQ